MLDSLQSVGSFLFGMVALTILLFALAEPFAEVLARILQRAFGAKPADPTIPAERRSTATVRTLFEKDAESGHYKGKITAQGEIWTACWFDGATEPPPIGTKVRISRIEGLMAFVEPLDTDS